MPAYEVVLRQADLSQKVRFSCREVTEIGEIVAFDSDQWVVVEKEPPFERRRIERLVCRPAGTAV